MTDTPKPRTPLYPMRLRFVLVAEFFDKADIMVSSGHTEFDLEYLESILIANPKIRRIERWDGTKRLSSLNYAAIKAARENNNRRVDPMPTEALLDERDLQRRYRAGGRAALKMARDGFENNNMDPMLTSILDMYIADWQEPTS